MPTITLDRKQLESYLKKQTPEEKLREAIIMIGTDLENLDEKEVKTEVFPDRPDMLSAAGFARALNHFLGYTTTLDTYKAQPASVQVHVKKSVSKVRPHTTCAIVRGLALTDEAIKEIIELQEKLHVTFGRRRKKVAVGIYPLDKIAWPVTFQAQKPEDIVFTPLDAKGNMNAKQLLEQHPTGKQYAHLLEGEKFFPVFRDANNNVLSVPPVINSETVGRVDETTTDVFIECSGHDRRPLGEALTMIVTALAQMGGSIESVEVVYEGADIFTDPVLEPHTMKVDLEYVTQRTSVPKKAIAGGLQKMGLVLDGNTVTIPCYRTDFLHMADVVEDAAIGYGYNNIKPRTPNTHTIGGLSKKYLLLQKIREVLAGCGALECVNFYLRKEGLELANPTNAEYGALRSTVLECLIDTLARNTNHNYPQDLFELGPVFTEDKKQETCVREDTHVAYVACGEHATYTAARQALETLAQVMGYTIIFEEHDDERFISGRCAKISGDLQGIIGEYHPAHTTSKGIMMPVAGWEVNYSS